MSAFGTSAVALLLAGWGMAPATAQPVPGARSALVATSATSGVVTAASAYRYWSYWWGKADGSWTYATMGAPSRVPKDATVEGWRFAVSGDGPAASRAPRTSASFGVLCPDLTTAPAGAKRIALVLDSGTAADAPAGETPPVPRVACVTVPVAANGVQVLAAATSIRSKDGLVCGLGGYPKTECAENVAGPTPTPTRPPAKAPVKAPVRAPLKAPARAPVKAPAVAPPNTSTTAPSNGSVVEDTTSGAPGEVPVPDNATGGDQGALAGVPEVAQTSAAEQGTDPELTPEVRASGDQSPLESDGIATESQGLVAQPEAPVTFVRQDTEDSSSGAPVATLAGVAALVVTLLGVWLFSRRRRASAAAGSVTNLRMRHRRR